MYVLQFLHFFPQCELYILTDEGDQSGISKSTSYTKLPLRTEK